ncbi:MAG: YbaN family protein [Rhodospirillales bacterium]
MEHGQRGVITAPPQRSRRAMLFWRLLGLAFVGIGFVGIVLPVLPTTPFMLLALWAFAKGSPVLHAWLVNHPRFGPSIAAWNRHGAIPLRAKLTAIAVMGVSLTILVLAESVPRVGVVSAAILMAVGAAFILTRPSNPPTG